MGTKNTFNKTGRKPRSLPAANGSARAPMKKKALVVEINLTKPASPLRGILPVPREVEELVMRELARRPASSEARLRVTDHFKMQFYFGGHWIAFRKTPRGVEVLAVGRDEIRKLKKKRMSQAERSAIVTWKYDPW